MVTLSRLALFTLAPRAILLYKQAFAPDVADAPLRHAGLLAGRLRLEHFLAQILHESGGLRLTMESLSYSASRIREIGTAAPPNSRWRSLVPFAGELAHNPRAFANAVYGGRMGNTDVNDGFKYCGRGPLQLTGKGAYKVISDRLGVDFV